MTNFTTYDPDVWNGTTAFKMVTAMRCDNRSAIVLRRKADDSFVVGKNYELNGDQVAWCWGCYDIKTEADAKRIARAWCFD